MGIERYTDVESALTFPVSTDGLVVEALIGLDVQTTASLHQAGSPITAPIRVRALIDTGSDASAVAPRVFQALGLLPIGSTTTHTAGGQTPVNLYRVSLSISGTTAGKSQILHRADLVVTELPGPLPGGTEALVGMDVLSGCLLILDGPGKQFTLAF